MKIFEQEKIDGLSEIIASNTSIAYNIALEPLDTQKDSLDSIVANINEVKETIDLYPVKTILASTGWNKNADVFDPQEMWAARNTPEHKPVNIGHDQSKIRGHIVGCYPVDFEYKLIEGETIPEKFHLITAAVVYKVWKRNPDIQQEINELLAEIKNGEWFVSMEALFSNFDYALMDTEGKQLIIPRDESSAFLTKYLTAYGGTGKYKEYSVGRLMRNITFSGKGFVRNPANKYSVILAHDFNGTISNIGEIMSEKNEVDAKVTELSAQVASLQSELSAEKNAFVAYKEVAEQMKTDYEAKITALETSKAELQTEVDKFIAEAKLNTRKTLVMSKGKTAEEAVEFVKKFEKLDEDSFASVVDLIVVTEVKKEIPTDELKETVSEAPLSGVEHKETVAGLREYFKSILLKGDK